MKLVSTSYVSDSGKNGKIDEITGVSDEVGVSDANQESDAPIPNFSFV